MIESIDPAAKAGDVVAVYDRHGQFFGHGFYHDRSQIGLRMLSYEQPAIDDAFFAGRIAQALTWRRQIFGLEHIPTASCGTGVSPVNASCGTGVPPVNASCGTGVPPVNAQARRLCHTQGGHTPGDRLSDELTDAYRLIHAEGDNLSGLIAERYADWIAIEVFSLGIFRRLDLIKRLLADQTGIRQFVVRADDHIEQIEGFHVPPEMSDSAPKTVTVQENGIRFRVDLRAGHKTGFFCDQRENRKRLASLCRRLDVLDGCCYTGGFGIYAKLLGQADSVTAVDLDEDAIELAKANAKLNQVRITFAHSDVFGYLRQMQTNGRLFDVVVLDPPKFVPTRDDYREGSQKYMDLNALGMTVLKPGGLLLTCSCSGLVSRDDFLGMVRSAAARLRRPLQVVDLTAAGPDHPVMAHCPESAYLKALWLRVL
jgi:23S rRNA (cytosine1962-C5)-methyltransferase